MNIEELNHKLKKYKTKARYNPENKIYQEKIEYYNNLIGGADIYIDEQLKNYLNLDINKMKIKKRVVTKTLTEEKQEIQYIISGNTKFDIFYFLLLLKICI